jgi:hypothetical protein
VNWMRLAQNIDRWRAFVNTVINLQEVHKRQNFSITNRLLASQEELCSMELDGYLVSKLIYFETQLL